MSAVKAIRNFIDELPDDQIFTTRDLLHLTTSRTAIDVTMHRMVYMDELIRLARGVFLKNSPNQRKPSIEEVAVIKARSFGKKIYQHGINAAAEIGLIDKKYYKRTLHLFYTDGCSSSFRAGRYRVKFKSVSKRKTNISNTDAGKLLKAVWSQGRANIRKMRNKAMFIEKNLNRMQRLSFRSEVRIMPIWLVEMFYPRFKIKKTTDLEYD